MKRRRGSQQQQRQRSPACCTKLPFFVGLATLWLGAVMISWWNLVDTSSTSSSPQRGDRIRPQPVSPPPTTATTAVKNGTNELLVDYFANNGFAKALDTMQYPMGLYTGPPHNIAFVSFQGSHEDPYIAAYHHLTKTWQGPIQAGLSTLGDDGADPRQMHDGRAVGKTADNHGKPAMIIDDLGYIHISFGAHGGDKALQKTLGKNKYGDYAGGWQQHLRSRQPYDISAWDDLTATSGLSWNGCYAQFVKIGSVLYHFVRHGAHVSCWTMQRSVDHGNTWQPVQPLLLTKQQQAEHVKDSWYCRFRAGKGNKLQMILAVCVYHKHWMPPNHYLEAYNGYYMEMDTSTQIWYNVQGRQLTNLPLTKERADELIQVFDTEHSQQFTYKYTHPGSVALDMEGRPHFLYKIAVSGETQGPKVGRGRKQLFHVRWTGEKWTRPISVTGKGPGDFDEDGDFVVDKDGKRGHVEVIFSVNTPTNASIVVWESFDRGKSFQRGASLYTIANGSGIRLKNSALIYNGRPDARIVAYSIDPKRIGAYRGIYLIGSNGAIPRPKADADICAGQLVGNKGTICVPIPNENTL